MELNDTNYVEPKEITDCETNGEAREKLARFIFALRHFKERDLTRMQDYLQQFYVIETNPKIAEVIEDMHTLIRFVKEFLYGTKKGENYEKKDY